MRRNISINSGELYLGRNAGDKIFSSLRFATKSIKIVTPYTSLEFIDFLTQKALSNVNVSLILSSEFTKDDKKRIQIFRKLIQQNKITDHKKKRRRIIGLCAVIFSYIAVLLFLFVGYIEKFPHFEYAGFLIPVLIISHIVLKKMRVYSYTYNHLINFTVIMSPYSDPKKFNEDFYFSHAKIFIIDEELAYLGSMNFTRMGFYENYESRVKIDELSAVDSISSEFDYLYANSNTSYLNLDVLARSIYTEPPN